MQSHHFRSIWFYLTICFLAALFVNMRDRWHQIGDAIFNPAFHYAFLISFAVALILLLMVNSFNAILEESFPIRKKFWQRIVLQIIFPLGLPIFVDLVILIIYSDFFNISIEALMERDFQYGCLFLSLMNIYHLVYAYRDQSLKETSEVVLTIKHNGVNINLNVATDILFVYKYGRKTMVCTISGNRYSTADTISKLKEAYQSEGLFQVNPSALINLRMLTGHEPGTKLKTLTPLFKPQFQDKISSSNLEKLVVTRNFMSGFKKEMEKYRTPHVQIEDGLRQLP